MHVLARIFLCMQLCFCSMLLVVRVCNVFESFIVARAVHDLNTRSKGYFLAGSIVKRT